VSWGCIFCGASFMWVLNRKRSSKRLAIILLALGFAGSLLPKRVEACYQIEPPSVQLRARKIAGTVTLNGKPIDHAVLSLHKFLGDYSIEVGHADPHVMGEAITANDGSFAFGEVPSGKYVVIMARPSYELTNIEVVKPTSVGSDTVAIEYFADFCASATAISTDGRRLTYRSVPTIFGMSGSAKEK
jgi:hypothetical protein